MLEIKLKYCVKDKDQICSLPKNNNIYIYIYWSKEIIFNVHLI